MKSAKEKVQPGDLVTVLSAPNASVAFARTEKPGTDRIGAILIAFAGRSKLLGYYFLNAELTAPSPSKAVSVALFSRAALANDPYAADVRRWEQFAGRGRIRGSDRSVRVAGRPARR